MCLTIPKKVVAIKDNSVIVELPDGTRQEVKSLVELKLGDFCLTQQNVAFERVDSEEAEIALNMLKEIGGTQ